MVKAKSVKAKAAPRAQVIGKLRIATWNINSVRIRLDNVARFLDAHQPDILCLQETKVMDELFPRDFFTARGYVHQAIRGQKMYHGVAILSRVPLTAMELRMWCDKQDCRHLSVRLPNGIELHNFYVPAGGDIPDPKVNEKFAHKLQFVDEMTQWFGKLKHAGNKLVLVGDLNIAPLETDVWSHKQLLKVVSHTPVEVAAMAKLQASHDWVDAMREIIPPAELLYTWWSYRSPDWETADKGRRLDHIWVTPALRKQIGGIKVIKDMRRGELASDHAPVLFDLKAG